jgi:hypothetical protein
MKENYEVTKDDKYWALLAMEEAAEVQQAISKILRFGLSAEKSQALDMEVKDLMYSLHMLGWYMWFKMPNLPEILQHAQTKRGRSFVSVLNDLLVVEQRELYET